MSNASIFDDLLEETGVMSSPRAIEASEAYQTLLEEGDYAIPRLIEKLRDKEYEGCWVAIILLLRNITGEDPSPKADAGHIDRQVQAWRDWWTTRNS